MRPNDRRILAVLSSAAALGVGRSDDDDLDIVDTRASPTADFTSFETFAFAGPSDMEPDLAQDIPSDVALDLEIANAEMREELTELGPSPVSQTATTPGDFGVWLRFRCGPVLTYPHTFRSGPRESLAKTPNLPGGLSRGVWA